MGLRKAHVPDVTAAQEFSDGDGSELGPPSSDPERAEETSRRAAINNGPALIKSYQSIAIDKTLPFSTQQVVMASTVVDLPDVDDDLNRELAFYKQCVSAVYSARKLLGAEGIAMARPADYFAEMVKSDEHMQTIKSRMTADAVARKMAAEARRQRDLKKFGKAVQVAKLQERDRTRKETVKRIELLRRKRKRGAVDALGDDDALGPNSGQSRNDIATGTSSTARASGRKRQKKDARYGFGGKKRHSKSGDATSSGDVSAYSVQQMKGHRPRLKRPGKSRRTRS